METQENKDRVALSFDEVEAKLYSAEYVGRLGKPFSDDGIVSLMRTVADCDDHEGIDNVLLTLYLGKNGEGVDAQIQFQSWADGAQMDLKTTHLYGLGVGAEEAFTLLAKVCQPYVAGWPGIIQVANSELRLLIDVASDFVPEYR
ncbi:hypothetical protein IFT48_02570 [Pseudomonas fluorescens]|uniref:hypothetical protein n=1 Tax=Pseudomonas TaxID=286 RepID=UPI000F02BC93|nr:MULTISPECIES: hypothetical protein [Pseudomonas]MBD8088849.1 hypothetical protein [Pseudomonas fluorescens]MBD8614685.1 hypothetical protein [Pseudomonas putida]